jgi:arsenite methyltransferase
MTAFINAEMFNRGAMKDSSSVLQKLNIKEGSVVADIGSGGGFFAFEFARRTGPDGIVLAVDKDASLLSYINGQKQKKRLFNIVTVTAKEDDPRLFTKCDLIFMRDVFHHIGNPEEYYTELKESLKPDGRLAIIDWKPEAHNGHGTSEEQIKRVMSVAGYRISESYDFLGTHSFNIFWA